ncbi:Ribokinase-like protein [Rhodotorula diobovata]|uniref:Ribokinase n=1 Tax=Rhodotorula diobovata TaxID=5288 RepID=A0A5C5FVM7_9BASI|nr:Ribokinase-like protein [Rhodotorula diobovata]
MSQPHGSPRLLVRGSINIDEFFVVDHIVRSGETIASTDYSRRAGGKGANQAVAAAKAGAAVDFAGVIGHDGGWLRETLGEYGVGLSLIEEDDKTPTGRAIIQLSSSTADNSIVLLPGANFSASASPHPRLPSSALSSYTHLLLQNEIPLQETRRTLRDAHAAGLVTLFNPSPMPKREDLAAFEWGALDWLVINAGEAEDLLVALASEEFAAAAQSKGPEALLRALRETSLRSLTGIIMTRGAEGVSCSLREHPGETMQVSAGKVVGGVKDTTGAGDCFTGYFATLLASLPGKVSSDEGASVKLVKHCLVVASQAAAMCVETPGAMESVPKLGDVITRMGERWKDVELSFPALEATP